MIEILSRCGFRCDLCLAYKPNIQAHPENAQLLSDGWHTYFGFRIPPEKIMCDGCLARTQETLDKGCPVRPCVNERQFPTCADCGDYPCEKLEGRLITLEGMEKQLGSSIPGDDRTLFILPYENKDRLDRLHQKMDQSPRA